MLSGKIINLKRVVVTGMGLISPLGNSVAASWDNLLAGRSGLESIFEIRRRFGRVSSAL